MTFDRSRGAAEADDAGLDLLWQVDADPEAPAAGGLRSYARTLAGAVARPGGRGRVLGAAVGGLSLAYAVLAGPYLIGAGALFRTPPPSAVALADDSDFRPATEPGQRPRAKARPGTGGLLPPVRQDGIPAYVRKLVAEADKEKDAEARAPESTRVLVAAPRPRQAPPPEPEVRVLPDPDPEPVPRASTPRPVPAPPGPAPAPAPAPTDRAGPGDDDTAASPTPTPTAAAAARRAVAPRTADPAAADPSEADPAAADRAAADRAAAAAPR